MELVENGYTSNSDRLTKDLERLFITCSVGLFSKTDRTSYEETRV